MSKHYTSEPLYPRRTLKACTEAAMQAFKDAGKRPTCEAVRKISGGGSDTTINKAINQVELALIKDFWCGDDVEGPTKKTVNKTDEPLKPEPFKDVAAKANPDGGFGGVFGLPLVTDASKPEAVNEYSNSNPDDQREKEKVERPKSFGTISTLAKAFVRLANKELERLLELEMTGSKNALASAEARISQLESDLSEKNEHLEAKNKRLKEIYQKNRINHTSGQP